MNFCFALFFMLSLPEHKGDDIMEVIAEISEDILN